MNNILLLTLSGGCGGEGSSRADKTPASKEIIPQGDKPAEAQLPVISPRESLNDSQKSLLTSLGFRDSNNDGLVLAEEQQTRLDPKVMEAFKGLAAIDGYYADTIDGGDLDALIKDPKALAKVIRLDPEYKGDVLRYEDAVLKKGRIELGEDRDRDGVPQKGYRRLMTYAQLGLNHLFGSSSITTFGSFGSQTSALVERFHPIARLASKRSGDEIDRTTFGALLIHLEHSKEELKSQLSTLRERMIRENQPGFYLDSGNETLSFLIVRSLQYLYPEEIRPFEEIVGVRLREQANTILKEKFGGTLIGPNIIGKIIEELTVC